MSSRDLRRLCQVVAVGLVGWIPMTAVGPTTVAQASQFRGNAACNLLDYAGMAPEVLNGQPGSVNAGPGFCQIGRCWKRATDPENPEQTICHYARGAILNLKSYGTARQARQAVLRSINRGYRRGRLAGAALAGFIVNSKGAAAVMAVDNTAALFSFGASSDDDPSPTWVGARQLVHSAARDIARGLGRPGCPEQPRRCPGSVHS